VKPLPVLSVVAVLAGAGLAAGCDRETRRWREPAPSEQRPDGVPRSTLHAGPVPERVETPARALTAYRYDGNAWAIAEGKRLFTAFNCAGCHSLGGGGGMGPPLRDRPWIYGHTAGDIYQSIVEGRPNGMPAFRNKLAEQDVWKLVAYVRSLGRLVPRDAVAARDDHARTGPSPILDDEPAIWPDFWRPRATRETR
jgi:cytochrome c oxidase cbb3-type subunit 3